MQGNTYSNTPRHQTPQHAINAHSATAMLSSDPHKAMQEMMSTIDHLRDVYIKETDALENSDSKAFLALQNDKLNAAQNYQSGIEQILIRKDEMRSVDPSLRKRLQKIQSEFAELGKKNMDALTRMQRCTERIGKRIRNAAKDAVHKNRAFSYDARGSLQKMEKKSVSTGISETA